jgi:hypothetical protein
MEVFQMRSVFVRLRNATIEAYVWDLKRLIRVSAGIKNVHYFETTFFSLGYYGSSCEKCNKSAPFLHQILAILSMCDNADCNNRLEGNSSEWCITGMQKLAAPR